MDNFILLALCFGTGILLRRFERVPENASATLNGVIIYFSFPAVVLEHVHGLPITTGLVLPALMAWIVFAAAWLGFGLRSRRPGLDRRTAGCLILTAGLGNTSFVGLPMIEALYGPGHLGIGIVCDQAGSFMVLSTLGIIVAAGLSGAGFTKRQLAGRVLTFPPFVALLTALVLKPFPYPEMFTSLLKQVGATLAPLALLSVGLSMRLGALRGRLPVLFAGLGYKMILAPLLILGLYVGLLGQSGEVIQVTVFEAAMPPMITGGIVAMQYGLDEDLAGLLLGIGIPLGFLTLPLWSWLLGWV